MKKTFVAAMLLFAAAASAQTKKPTTSAKPAEAKPVAKPGAKPVTAASAVLKNITDSASYAIGVSVAQFYQQQGMSRINSKMVARAIEDIIGKKTALLTEQQCQMVMMELYNKAQEANSKIQEEKAKPNIEAGNKFLAENQKRPEVKTTASGLQYEVVVQGTGAKPTAEDTVVVNYKGTLLNGEEFDNSYKRGEPISFPLNRVIPGWTEGVQLMSAGSKFKFYIPQQLAYGTTDSGPIPGGSTLVFEVELLEVKGKK